MIPQSGMIAPKSAVPARLWSTVNGETESFGSARTAQRQRPPVRAAASVVGKQAQAAESRAATFSQFTRLSRKFVR